jgi:hypothetical protein
MKLNRPPAIAMQLDRCDVCGDKMHRSDLVRTQVEFLDKKAENYLGMSSYDGTYWVCDAVDEGSVSYGTRADNARLTLGDDNELGYINGVQTWSGTGTMRSASATVNLSANGSVTFSAHVGPHEQNTSPSMTVELGITNSDGSSPQLIRTWTINGTTRVWFTEVKQTLIDYGLGPGGAAWYFYVKVTNAGKWWIDETQMESNTASGMPEVFVRSTGGAATYVSNQSDRSLLTQRKVCGSCSERILSKSERFGRTDESPIDEPVDTWAQEI